MCIVQYAEQRECVVNAFARIEYNELVFIGLIELLVVGEEGVGAEVGEDVANAINEHVRPVVFIVLTDVLQYALMDVFVELLAIGLHYQHLGHSVWIGFLHVQKEFHQRGVLLAKTLRGEKITELIEQVKGQCVHVRRRANQVLAERLDLVPHVVFLLCFIREDEEVVKQITISRILELGCIEFMI